MNISKAQYTNYLGNRVGIQATIDGQEMSVPIDTDNRHYQAILEWVEDGNTIEDAD